MVLIYFRYPPDAVNGGGGDPNNNLHQHLMQMQWAAAAAAAGRPTGSAAMNAAQVQQAVAAAAAAAQHQQVQGGGGGGRGRSRDRPGRVDPEQRRRAQSKSPARAAAAAAQHQENPGIREANPGISKKFREFSDAVRQRMGKGKSHSQLDVVDFSRAPCSSGPLKSNLKKNLSSDLAPPGNPVEPDSDSNDNRKVHFNKFATVQMME